jgi:hypothetical protein
VGEVHTSFWYGILYEGRRPLGKPKLRWEDNISTDAKEIGWDGANWTKQTGDLL